MDQYSFLMVPGIGPPAEGHWQSLWRHEVADGRVVEQANWDRPDLDGWLSVLDRYLAACRKPAVLVAHSLGCVLVAHWVERSRRGQIAGPMPAVAAAMLVAPGDVDQERPGFEVVQPFAPMPLPRFPFPSIVVASTDDFFVSAERARHFARGWGSDYLCVGAMGHISVETGCGPWPRGLAVLADFLRRQVPPRP